MATNKKSKKLSIDDMPGLEEQSAKLQILKSITINDALHSKDVDSIYKAQKYLQSIQQKDQTVKPQSMLYDPQQLGADGYKNKSFRLSYEMLRAMGNVPIIKAIVETRKEQVLSFCEPQKDKYSTGFVIRPKKAKHTEAGIKLSKQEEQIQEELTEFILNCGDNPNAWHGDDFVSFTRKFIADSLVLDQGTFEPIRNRMGELCEFIATDGATYRMADTHNDERISSNLQKGEKNGYLPYYVQVYQSRILAEFYPWELCLGIRNPSSSIMTNGYGRSELEDLIETVTSILNADQYNSNYFKVGANPKGILRVSGNVNQGRIQEFQNQWGATMAGVKNAHKLLVMEGDKMDFVSTQGSNKDMEYAKYQEFLIKITCANYKIDPSEIGFPMAGSSDQPAFGDSGSSSKQRLDFSKEKGLKPLLKAYQSWLNKYIISVKAPGWEIVFEGLDVETPEQEMENDVKAVTNWSTINEIRRKRGMDDIEGGDIIANPIFMQGQMMAMQGNQESNQFMADSPQNDQEKKDNPFMKSLSSDLEQLFAKAV